MVSSTKKRSTLAIISVVIGGISFIPLIGFFLGIAAVILGIVAVTKHKNKLGYLGLALGLIGILITVALYGSLFYFGFIQRGAVYDELRTELAKAQLVDTINAIEAYKVRYGYYPDSMENLTNISSTIVIYDTINPLKIEFYYYENHGDYYYVFSKGSDGKPFTDDDVFADLTDQNITNLGYRKP